MTAPNPPRQASLRMRLALAGAICVAATLTAAPALAQDTAAAARAFQTAQKAELSEDFGRAAEFYELADSLVSSPEAIRSALRSRRRAGQNAIAAGHAETLLKRYPTDEPSRKLAQATLKELKPTLIAVRVNCGDIPCRVLVDKATVTLERATDHVFYLTPGEHQVHAEYPNGSTTPQPLTDPAGAEKTLAFQSPPPPVVVPEPTGPKDGATGNVTPLPAPLPTRDTDMGGISPWFFIGAVTITAGMGVGTLISGLQANTAGDDFYGSGRTRELFESADSLEVQTNVFIGLTAGFGAAAVALAIFTDWDGTPDQGDSALIIGPGPGTVGLSIGNRF